MKTTTKKQYPRVLTIARSDSGGGAGMKQYITGALAAGADYTIGKGHGPVDHFYLQKIPAG